LLDSWVIIFTRSFTTTFLGEKHSSLSACVAKTTPLDFHQPVVTLSNGNNSGNLLFNVYKVQNLLSLLDQKVPHLSQDNKFILDMSSVGFPTSFTEIILFINLSFFKNQNKKSTKPLISKNIKYTLGLGYDGSDINLLKNFFSINFPALNHHPLTIDLEYMLLKSIQTSVLLGKQDRWLWKSSILNTEFVSSFSNLNYVKKSVGDPLTPGFNSNYNIWISGKLQNQLGQEALNNNFLNFFNKKSTGLNYLMTNPQVLSTNFIESSLAWGVKRYMHLQGMHKNFQIINSTSTSFLKADTSDTQGTIFF